MTTWQDLHTKFSTLEEKTGRSKSNSFFLSVVFGAIGEITVTLGTGDIPGWSRVTHLGPFKDEGMALDAVRAKINEAQEACELFNKQAVAA